MVEVSCEVLIPTDAGRVFDVITDFAGQERWLAKTATFRGTSAVSSNPVTLGTTYRERGPLGVRTGVVTEFVRATQVTFDQPMALSLGLGRVELVVRYTLTSQGESTRVRRAVRV